MKTEGNSRLRVLLISPSSGVDPFCGDVTITSLVLNSVTEKFAFETYVTALRTNRMRNVVSAPVGFRENVESFIVKVINRFRRTGLLFQEDFRIYEIDSESYDLVHVFVFSVSLRFKGKPLPVVMSQAISNKRLYLDARKWSLTRWKRVTSIERFLGLLFGIQNPNISITDVDLYLAYTEFHANECRSTVDGAINVQCWHPFIDSRQTQAKVQSKSNIVLGFIAKDFYAKGGDVAIRVLSCLRSRGVNAELHIFGSDEKVVGDGVVSHGFINRDELIANFFGFIDIVIYPTRFDGWPLIIGECQMSGLPVIVSQYGGLSEMVESNDFVVESDDPSVWADRIQSILMVDRNTLRSRIHTFATNTFGEQQVMNRLAQHYKQVID